MVEETESPFHNGPIDTLAALESMTAAWVSRYNQSRLMHPLGRAHPLKPKPRTTLNDGP